MIVGIEVQRYKLTAAVLSIIDKLNLRWTTTLLARSTLSEQHPHFLGVFNGEKAPQSVKDAINRSDLIVALGEVFGSGHASIMLPKHGQTIRTWDGQIVSLGSPEQPVGLTHYITALEQQAFSGLASRAPETQEQDERGSSASPEEDGESAWDGDRGAEIPQHEMSETPKAIPTPVPVGLTYSELFSTINEAAFLDASFTIIPDTFLGIYSAASPSQIRMPGQNCFISSALWASIGHSVGAGVGAAIPGERRPLVICGDGGFQMTSQALSTMKKLNMNAIVIVVDNGLYGYEQYLLDKSYYTSANRLPLPYAELSRWAYSDLVTAMGVSLSVKADSVASLRTALARARAHTGGPSFVQAVVRSRSLPPGL